MRKISFLFLICVFAVNAFSQHLISPALNDALANNAGNYLSVNVFFENAESVSQLANELDAKSANFDIRVKSVSNLLKNNSELSYKNFSQQLEALLQEDKSAVRNVTKFWVVNFANIEVKAEYVYKIASFAGILSLDLDAERYKIIDGTKVVSKDASRSVGGVEWGLTAVNAPALWRMNYSGRNVLMLSIDTGVNPEHPAISTNYLGNYFPQSQCWYGMRNDNPRDNASSSHGTHTTGTALGLDRQTKDTIGMAFNAKWIACDPVASTTNELLTVSQFCSVYQWVLNPDGDDETTFDVPRVINNSWGYDYETAANFDACNLPENSIVETLEAAGICSPYSAGNEGPNASTVGYPAMLAYNLVNPMAVAAVDANSLVASFSSRGPSLCVDEDNALKIKPEVSAPGVNVRSCEGFDGYQYLQGTSMACPHVSGALLLLIEAFPQASAKQLKEAIYFTAHDLGDEGEDNTYGNGMIDVLAAYNYLAQTFTPQPPLYSDYDIAVSGQISYNHELPEGFTATCLAHEPQVTIKVENRANNSVNAVNVNIYDGEQVFWTQQIDSLTAGEIREFILTDIPQHSGVNELKIVATTESEIQELDVYNNQAIVRFYKFFEKEFPYNLTFNLGYAVDNQINVENPNMKKTWRIYPWGENKEHNALAISFSQNRKYKDVDYAYIPQVDLPDEDSIFLNFAYAYKRHYTNADKDSLFIEVSTDCGETFPYQIWKNGGQALYTETGNSEGFYIPQHASEFDTIAVPLTDFKGQNVVIRFVAKNQQNSELYIDRIALQDKRLNNIENQHIAENQPRIAIFPNPSSGNIKLDIPINYIGSEILLFNVCGVEVKRLQAASDVTDLDLQDLESGMYILRLAGTEIYEKIILTKKY